MVLEKIRVGIIGSGNIAQTRHIPALRLVNRADLVGIVGVHTDDVRRAAHKHRVPHWAVYSKETGLNGIPWIEAVEAWVVATPPFEHHRMAAEGLAAGKHVLVEKPMALTPEEAEDLVRLKNTVGKTLCVMHNFQFGSGVTQMEKWLRSGKAGKITSFLLAQITNKTRRLPAWQNRLPLGLFYDETPHFFYLLRKFGGPVAIQSATAVPSPQGEATPLLLTANLTAGSVPATIYINFESPISEWFFIAHCDHRLLLYDFFRDLLITIPNDRLHLPQNVLSNSFRFTYDHWKGTLVNGLRRISGRLMYGFVEVYERFFDAIQHGRAAAGITAEDGLETVRAQYDVIRRIKTDESS
jgi:predicted dehydrogenase